MTEWIRFLWSATRGSRLRPWRSPYLRWRMETYTGKKAESIRPRDLAELLWSERGQMLRFFGWLGAMRRYREAGRGNHGG